nr:MAG TPA: hypothetical protein [Caudoviricetes sp.]
MLKMNDEFDILMNIADNAASSYISEIALFALRCL